MGLNWLTALTGSQTTSAAAPESVDAWSGGSPPAIGSIADYCARFPNHPACGLVGKGDHNGDNNHNNHNNHNGGDNHHGPLS